MLNYLVNVMITIKVDQAKLEEMKSFYADCIRPNEGEYVFFDALVNGVTVIGYNSKKATKKVTFVGENALMEARIWDENAEELAPKQAVREAWQYFGDQIGSDEVGVGDFLLPMVVVAAYLRKDQIDLLKELGVHDSKKLNDSQILEIGPRLAKEFKYSKLTLPNEKYNEMILKGENLNSLKAKMHNRALLNMHREHPEVINIFIDEFVAPKTYYKYLNDANEEIVGDVISHTKGESYYPCVALASVIARYSFLLEKKKLEEKVGMELPFGSSSKATKAAKVLLEKLGQEEFDKLVKKNFANYREVVSIDLL